MLENVKVYCLTGPANVGKGTLLGEAEKKFGDSFTVIGTGAMFRKEIELGTAFGKEIKQYMDDGLLVPDGLICSKIVDIIKAAAGEGKEKIILDGFPRTPKQVGAMLQNGIVPNRVIELTLPDEILVERGSDRECCVSCGETYTIVNEFKRTAVKGVCDKCGGKVVRRADDEPAKVRKRLESYRVDTCPMFEEFENADIEVVVIDNNRADAKEKFFAALEF